MTSLYRKLIIGAVIAAFLWTMIASWLVRGATIERLEETLQTITLAATQATVKPDSKGQRKLLTTDQVPAALAALRSSADSCDAALAGINQNALRDSALKAKLDGQLSAILDGQDAAAEGTKSRITDLLARQASGDKVKDCEAMESDSNAAWEGWKK